MVDADEHGDAPHDAGPLPLELMRLSQMAVEAGVQQADNSCEKEQKQTRITRDKQKSVKRRRANPVMELLCGIILFAEHALP